MPNIGIHGYSIEKGIRLKNTIVKCMQDVGFGGEAIWEIFPTKTGICDGSKKPSQYLRIFSSNPDHIPIILEGFRKYGIYEDVEVLLGLFFDKVNKREISSRELKNQFTHDDGHNFFGGVEKGPRDPDK